MGKIKFLIFGLFFCLTGCSSNDSNENEIIYSNNQIQVLKTIKGHWYDTQFSQIVNGIHVNPTIIAFNEIYETPIAVNDGGNYVYTKHGNCRFTYPYDGVSENYVLCGFYISPDGKTLDLRYSDNNKLFHYYKISIINDKEILLHQNGLSLPYRFIKMDNPPK